VIVLGISGFEDLAMPAYPSTYSATPKTMEELFGFSSHGVPLQCFPLHLIGHDSAAALLVDGKLVAFISEERLTRIKHGFNLAGRTVLPRLAIRYCLEQAGITFQDVDYIAHYCKFEKSGVARRFDAVANGLPRSERLCLAKEYESSYENRLSGEVLLRQLSQIAGFRVPKEQFIRVPHHLAHAAGAFYSSGFPEAVVLAVDGYGEEESTFWGVGGERGITAKGSISLPSSLGVLYQIVTTYLGFRSFGDEFKVMGLASYGDPDPFRHVFEQIVTLLPDGTFEMKKLARPNLLPWLREAFGPIDSPGDISSQSADIAAALQQTLERTLLHLLTALRDSYQVPNLCLSGGVALNACANGAILDSGLFERVFIQPAAGDDGACLALRSAGKKWPRWKRPRRNCWRRGRSWAGFKAGQKWVPGRLGQEASSPIRAPSPCGTSSTPRSRTANPSGPSRLRSDRPMPPPCSIFRRANHPPTCW
jgi:carbamoyltransferase